MTSSSEDPAIHYPYTGNESHSKPEMTTKPANGDLVNILIQKKEKTKNLNTEEKRKNLVASMASSVREGEIWSL